MRRTDLVTRMLAVFCLIEIVFTVSGTLQMSGVFGFDVAPLGGSMLLLMAVRVSLYWAIFRRLVRPTTELQRRVAAGESISESSLCAADRALQATPTALAAAAASAYAISYPLVFLLYHQFVGDPDLPSFEGGVLAMLSLNGALSAVVVAILLLTWLLAGAAGELHQIAAQRGIDLQRSPRSISGRLILVGICLATAPALQVIGGNLAGASRDLLTATQNEARAAAGELRAELSERSVSDALATVAARFDAARTTLFVLDGEELRFQGSPAPAWASRELLAKSTGQIVAPERAVAMSANRVSERRCVGAIVRMPSLATNLLDTIQNMFFDMTLFGLVCAWLLSKSIAAPLRRVAELASRAAQRGDLSQMGTLPVAQLDEVGLVTLNLNQLLDDMRGIAAAAGEIGSGRLDVDLSGEGELRGAFRQMLTRLKTVVGELHATAAALAAAATEINAASQEQEAGAVSQAAGMTEISKTMDSLSESAARVAVAVEGVLANAEQTLANTDQMVTRINDLTGHANRIGDILEVIRDIADRADLLALNGSLEATRAGEAGLGFSLVASEMRRLAERITASVGDVKALVADIRESGASTVVATEESRKLAQSTTQAARGITVVSQQQQTSTEQVSANVRAIADVVQQTASATSQTRAAADRLKAQADHLAETVQTFRLGD